LIVPIGRWVLKTACLQNVAWQKQGLVHASIAVNLTPRQFFDEHLLRDITSILSGSGMAANMLEVEIHESLLLHNLERTLFVLGSLKKLGVRIAVDDFGIGYSSLATLQRFPLDTVKIDRSCIRDLANLEGDRRLTQAVIAVGKSLSLTVVAQGVENEAQAEFLRRHACDELQGFYVDRPVTARQFTELLRVQAANTALLD
jgi:EAL domain-containing protein (putative c-di-GMP-specific phosphodiesterase class I)